ncbi:MAG: glycosyltransferase [Fibrobacterota bacterium]
MYYLRHRNEALDIIKKAEEKVLDSHTYRHRILDILNKLF